MSITRRILEGAQSSWSKLTSLVIVDDEPLSHVDPAALQAELTARKAARAARTGPPAAVSKLATSSATARAQRQQVATERRTRIHKERDQRKAAARAASDDAFRRIKEQAARAGGVRPGGSGGGGSRSGASGGASGSARAPRAGTTEAKLAEWYKALDVPFGADLPEVKAAYRRLMRRYHPDVHASSPEKQKAATELSVRVTTAYNALSAHLEQQTR